MISKTRTRYIAEICLISTTALVCIVFSTERKVENDITVADEGVSLLYKLVSQLYNNLPILHVKSGLFF